MTTDNIFSGLKVVDLASGDCVRNRKQNQERSDWTQESDALFLTITKDSPSCVQSLSSWFRPLSLASDGLVPREKKTCVKWKTGL
jgi:hypothetical protein